MNVEEDRDFAVGKDTMASGLFAVLRYEHRLEQSRRIFRLDIGARISYQIYYSSIGLSSLLSIELSVPAGISPAQRAQRPISWRRRRM